MGSAARLFPAMPALLIVTLWLAAPARAAAPVRIVLKNHGFTPDTVHVPANKRLLFDITNQDATPAEFESSDLRVEKIVVPGGRILVRAGPLRPGTYRFFDDYHPDQARGTVIASQSQTGQ
ncbi:cupredoxin domain-containing protein [Lichenicoccus sp.]|uniref:cupredoxin domain-containing protein n=1 Tax=Lichenicoccus sp. TaxID=2781899 RepID=UPI003D0EAC50